MAFLMRVLVPVTVPHIWQLSATFHGSGLSSRRKYRTQVYPSLSLYVHFYTSDRREIKVTFLDLSAPSLCDRGGGSFKLLEVWLCEDYV